MARMLHCLVCAVLLGISATAIAQQQEAVSRLNQRAMELNREGEWLKAAQVADGAAQRMDATEFERAEAWYCAAYARLRLGERERAQANLKELLAELKDAPSDHWLRREAETLRAPLAAPTPPPLGPDATAPEAMQQPDIGATLFEMRRANADGRHEQAIEFGTRALQHSLADYAPVRAEAMMHMYYAHRRMDQVAEADAALKDFEQFRERLSSESTLGLQMLMVRRSLGDEVPATPDERSFEPKADTFWQRVDPAEVAMDAAALREHEKMCLESGADAVLVARHGKIVSEWYSPLYREPVMTMSSVKSITALLAGLLVADGKLTIDDPVCKFIPQWCEGLKAQATVRDLLRMTAGLPKLSTGGVGMGHASMSDMAIAQNPAWAPATKWAYSNEGAQLLSPVLERAAGMPLWKYADERLFSPMGMTQTRFRRDKQGNTNTFADAHTTLREFARFGVLVLNRGRWDGKQVVPESWIAQMVSPGEHNAHYGFLWWLYDNPRVWAMEGYLNTSMWAFPDLDVVVCRVQGAPYLHARRNYDAKEMFKLIVRAMKTT